MFCLRLRRSIYPDVFLLQGGQCLSKIARLQLRRWWIHKRAQRRGKFSVIILKCSDIIKQDSKTYHSSGQSELKPTIDGWARIHPDHSDSEAAYHSECERAENCESEQEVNFLFSGDHHDKNDPRSAVYRARRPAH